MVPKKGLEPPHPCGYMDLNHARLPIPPLRQVTTFAGRHVAALKEELRCLFLQGAKRVSNFVERLHWLRLLSFDSCWTRIAQEDNACQPSEA